MKIIIDEYRYVDKSGIEGTEEENSVVTLNFEFPEEIQDFVKYIEFDIGNDKVFDLVENDTYTLTSAITKYEEVSAQIVAKKDEQVWKSKIFNLKFNKSINANNELEKEEHIDVLNTVIQRVDLIENEIAELNKKIETIQAEKYDDTELRESISNLEQDKANKEDVYTKEEIEEKITSGEFKGEDGFSPTANVTQNESGATINITDKNGTTTANIFNGRDGQDGQNGINGQDGKDGVSPLATITQTSSGATISIVDKNGTTSVEIKNGVDGKNGTNGKDGENGVDGQDGKNYSVEVAESTTTTLEIQPNKFYKFGEVTELNLTLAEITDNTELNEYMFEFVSGSTATTLTLPNTIKWLETPSIESNKTYQCSIVNNIGVLLGVSNV